MTVFPVTRPTVVIDAGGRYGLHPSWKPFRAPLRYVLFEPDHVEAERLSAKYARRGAEVTVEPLALAERDGSLRINFFRNRAMSSSAERRPLSALYQGERSAEVTIVESVDVVATSIDTYARERDLAVDFLKLDTEGTEFEILRGSVEQLEHDVLGVRAEVSFERTFVGKELFGSLHEFMLDRDFYLLNLDYEGRGDYQNEYARIDRRYGILSSTDAVWLRSRNGLFDALDARDGPEVRVLKYAAFCFHNNAPDVAIDVLLEARKKRGLSFIALRGDGLYAHVDVLVQHHLYSLKWVPGQSLRGSAVVYSDIFEAEMKTVNEFMESLELNPD